MNVLRYANRVPLQFQAGACAITPGRHGHQLALLRPEPVARPTSQRPGDDDGPHGQRLGSLHQRIEGGRWPAIPRFKRSCGWALQAVGRKLGMYLRRREPREAEGQRRAIFLRYLGRSGRRP